MTIKTEINCIEAADEGTRRQFVTRAKADASLLQLERYLQTKGFTSEGELQVFVHKRYDLSEWRSQMKEAFSWDLARHHLHLFEPTPTSTTMLIHYRGSTLDTTASLFFFASSNGRTAARSTVYEGSKPSYTLTVDSDGIVKVLNSSHG